MGCWGQQRKWKWSTATAAFLLHWWCLLAQIEDSQEDMKNGTQSENLLYLWLWWLKELLRVERVYFVYFRRKCDLKLWCRKFARWLCAQSPAQLISGDLFQSYCVSFLSCSCKENVQKQFWKSSKRRTIRIFLDLWHWRNKKMRARGKRVRKENDELKEKSWYVLIITCY